MTKRAALLLASLLSFSVDHALAADGVVEINHTCASGGGCFLGDAASYPVEIAQPGSYRLTSNLTVPAGVAGILLGANGVDIDLGGFEIAGPVACNPSCPPPSAGSGIAPVATLGNQCAVRSGKLRGFALDGIELGRASRVEDVTITEIARHGLVLGAGGRAARNLIQRTGENGMLLGSTGTAPSLYEQNAIVDTGGQSVENGRASGPNVCPDQLCGTSGKKFFYVTKTLHDGASADTACVAGFHMGSMSEIFEANSLEYDTTRGEVRADSGEGPPDLIAWVRTGKTGLPSIPGSANCNAWGPTIPGERGTRVGIAGQWDGAATTSSPWLAIAELCNTTARVWCVQD